MGIIFVICVLLFVMRKELKQKEKPRLFRFSLAALLSVEITGI